MKQLEQLPQIANTALGGLEATPEMLYRIQAKALKQQARKRRAMLLTKVSAPVLCALLLVSLILFPFTPGENVSPPSITSLPLGASTESENSDMTLASEVSVSSGRQSSQSGIWAAGSGSFPLIGINGRYYRMLNSPSPLASSMAGKSLGTVQEYTTEPSLSDDSIISSNCVFAGEEVFALKGMEGTFVCAKVNQQLTLFQRVSFNGHATVGRESLADTLQFAGHIRSISLSGVGTVSNPDQAEKLFSALTANATFQSNGSLSSSSFLTITLDQGITAQLLVSEDRVAACGVWSCPEFFEAFAKAIGQ